MQYEYDGVRSMDGRYIHVAPYGGSGGGGGAPRTHRHSRLPICCSSSDGIVIVDEQGWGHMGEGLGVRLWACNSGSEDMVRSYYGEYTGSHQIPEVKHH